jgi:hypothetical protein
LSPQVQKKSYRNFQDIFEFMAASHQVGMAGLQVGKGLVACATAESFFCGSVAWKSWRMSHMGAHFLAVVEYLMGLVKNNLFQFIKGRVYKLGQKTSGETW